MQLYEKVMKPANHSNSNPLTKYERLSLIAGFLSSSIAFLALASLLFAARQIGQATQSLESSAYQTLMGPQLELYKVFVEHPQVRRNFYSDT